MAETTIKLEGAIARFHNEVEVWCSVHGSLGAWAEPLPDVRFVYLHVPNHNLGAVRQLLEQEAGPTGMYLATVPASKPHLPSLKFHGSGFEKAQAFLNMAKSGTTPLGALPSELAAKKKSNR